MAGLQSARPSNTRITRDRTLGESVGRSSASATADLGDLLPATASIKPAPSSVDVPGTINASKFRATL